MEIFQRKCLWERTRKGEAEGENKKGRERDSGMCIAFHLIVQPISLLTLVSAVPPIATKVCSWL